MVLWEQKGFMYNQHLVLVNTTIVVVPWIADRHESTGTLVCEAVL